MRCLGRGQSPETPRVPSVEAWAAFRACAGPRNPTWRGATYSPLVEPPSASRALRPRQTCPQASSSARRAPQWPSRRRTPESAGALAGHVIVFRQLRKPRGIEVDAADGRTGSRSWSRRNSRLFDAGTPGLPVRLRGTSSSAGWAQTRVPAGAIAAATGWAAWRCGRRDLLVDEAPAISLAPVPAGEARGLNWSAPTISQMSGGGNPSWQPSSAHPDLLAEGWRLERDEWHLPTTVLRAESLLP